MFPLDREWTHIGPRSSVPSSVSGLADPPGWWPCGLTPPPLTSAPTEALVLFGWRRFDVDDRSKSSQPTHDAAPNSFPPPKHKPPYLPDVCGRSWRHWIRVRSWNIFLLWKKSKVSLCLCVMGLSWVFLSLAGFSCLLRTPLSLCIIIPFTILYDSRDDVYLHVLLHWLVLFLPRCSIWLQYSWFRCIISKTVYIMGATMDCITYP